MRGLEYLDEDDVVGGFEPIRKNADPVNANHDGQRRIENARNRQEREVRRKMKEEEI